MPKSKLRGGAKAHNTRVTHRNNTIRGLKKKAQAEYQEMFEKTKQIEAILMQEINPRVSTVDFYKPLDETQNSQPPKKRIKLSIS